jgi:hypothetical protein
MNTYKGTDKLGRPLPLQGWRKCTDGVRHWTEGSFVTVAPDQVVATELDLSSWVRDGYLEDWVVPAPAVAPVLEPVSKAAVLVPVEPEPIAPVVVPEPVNEIIPEPEQPVIVEKVPEPVVAPVVADEPEPVAKVKAKVEAEKPAKKGRFGRKA